LIIAAHIDQELSAPEVRVKHWGSGKVDAWLVYLFAQAYDIPTHYEPLQPLAPAYRDLLDGWRTTDRDAYRRLMQRAADFHLEGCGKGTDETWFEFEFFVTQFFPFELLVVQALRRRDGLPDFDTGHALIDAPWTMLRTLPQAPANPMLARVDARLREDYPDFR
jgi:hypothetical protein